jgi:uncharacterized membrane protein (DUF373 family)
MTVRRELTDAIDRWRVLTMYQRFERLVLLALSGLIIVVVLAALWNLLLRVLSLALSDTLDPTRYEVFQAVFGAIFTVMIALEFKRSILVSVERSETVFQVRTVILISLLAILRKFIILDLQTTEAMKVLALSVAVLTLGAAYWAVRDQDVRLERARRDGRTAVTSREQTRIDGG